MTVNAMMRALVDDLLEGEVPDPLGQEFTLALLWCDLARLAGEVPPVEVLSAADDCSPLPVPPLVPTLVRPGSYADHARQFTPVD